MQELKIHMKHFEGAMKKIRPLSNQKLTCTKAYQNNLEDLRLAVEKI